MITGVFGLTGAGKSTFLAWCASQALVDKPISCGHFVWKTPLVDNSVRYERVYTNFECPGCYKLNFNDLGRRCFENSLILIDEISLLCDSRNYKEFDDATKYFFTHHRKYNTDVIWCGQSYMDTDIKIRRLTKQYCFIESAAFGRSRVSPLAKVLEVSESGQIVEGFRDAPFFGCKWLKRSKYYKMFDSFERRKLPAARSALWSPPLETPSPLKKIKKMLCFLSVLEKGEHEGNTSSVSKVLKTDDLTEVNNFNS